jgi:two-component system, sensor histidine kinase
MPLDDIDDVDRLKRINAALIGRVERAMGQQENAFSLFQTAITLESRIRERTEELRAALRRLEHSNSELTRAKETAEQANISKTRFLAAASHDVLQPLNAAHLSVSALAELQTTEEGRHLSQQVSRALDTMEDLLRTLLDISRLDAGVVKPDLQDVALQPLFHSLMSDFSPMAASKGIVLRFRPTEAVIRTDRTMYRRVLQNIISNAIRYTMSGGVLVGTRSRDGRTSVIVADTGIGIPPDQVDLIYEEFQRGTNTHGIEKSSRGLGLGLAIAKRLVATLGHDISFTSSLEKGTIFRVTAQSSTAKTAEKPMPAGEAQRFYGLFGVRVLLVENDETTIMAMEALLRRWNCSVRIGMSNRDALAALSDTDWEPDIIIADQHLDQGDLGIVTIGEARQYLGWRVPALIVTADPSDALALAARQAGIELMHKPIKPAELRALMAHLLA